MLNQVRVTKTAPSAARLQRVLYAIALDPDQKFGTLEEQICLLGQAFQAQGGLFLPLFLCPPGPHKTRRFEAAGLAAECLDLRRFRPATLWNLVRLIKRQRIEVVHWNFSEALANSYLWWLTVLTPSVKHYYTDHNSRYLPIRLGTGRLRKLVKRLLLKRYGKVLCVSRFVQECLVQQRTWSNLHCCLHFVNANRFQPDPETRRTLRRELGVEHRFALVTIAHLIKEKGIDIALRALAELPDAIVYWVIGEGPETTSLKALCHELDLEERVRFLGLQPNVERYLQAADCLVCPSVWAEAAGLVNLEGLAVGLPVVASRIGGIPEYVDDGVTGYLFEAGDPHALADCVQRLQADPGAYRAMCHRARQSAVERFSASSRLDDFLEFYRA